MNDRVFIDSNVLIYAYSDEERKREKALDIIQLWCQVLYSNQGSAEKYLKA